MCFVAGKGRNEKVVAKKDGKNETLKSSNQTDLSRRFLNLGNKQNVVK